ncbi:MAG: hypothetical protein Q9183_002670 [Haloplaca sp. 2 TL-2023]
MTRATPAPPVLSTPSTHLFEDHPSPPANLPQASRSPEQIHIQYEIDRTVTEIKRGRWKRIALQFPDLMLPDAPRVCDSLRQRLSETSCSGASLRQRTQGSSPHAAESPNDTADDSRPERLFILADTSYGACCVDEIAAEHVDADVVVHYGQACLSPTARLPVIHVFTKQPLDVGGVMDKFRSTYPDLSQSIILMSDVVYASHLPRIGTLLEEAGYESIFVTDIVHNPSSPLPNRTVPENVNLRPDRLKEWHLFHLSDPPDALLLTLASRVASIHIFSVSPFVPSQPAVAHQVSSAARLRRRYALLTSVSTVSIFGILINTLSVKNYLHIVEHVKSCISAADKKSYTFVVGKINAAKVANFSEIGAWVVIGCWESSLVEGKDFWKPILTPFELQLALTRDEERVWTGEWKSDFQSVLTEAERQTADSAGVRMEDDMGDPTALQPHGDVDSEPESTPPEFDLRTGRYVSNSKPMQNHRLLQGSENQKRDAQHPNLALARRMKGDVAVVGNQVSPGAEYLRSSRTWKGLGSDLTVEYDHTESSESTAIEEGRSGLARGYSTALSSTKV